MRLCRVEKIKMNKRGIALILCYTVIIILAILGAVIVTSSLSENNIAKRALCSTKAFWCAEAGLSAAIEELDDTEPLNALLDGDTNIFYNTTTTPVAGYSNRWTINSVGSCVLARNSGGGALETINRAVRATVELPAGPNPDALTSAIATTGNLSIRGSVDINPSGSTQTYSTLTFENVFGMSKDLLKSLADNVYTNPETNQQPVSGITWVDVTGANKYVISSNWTGSGLLIINGNGEDIALDISGGWHFSGVIWVIGKLSISGTPVITGSVFAESAVDVTQDLTGNATINYNADSAEDAFDLLDDADLKANILSWQEINN